MKMDDRYGVDMCKECSKILFQKVLGHFALFAFCNEHLPLPLFVTHCWLLREVDEMKGKNEVHANFKCPIDEPKLLYGGRSMCVCSNND